MSLLLDTHVFVWWVMDAPGLNMVARGAIEDPETLVFISAASAWEISIKAALGKIEFQADDVIRGMEESGFTELPIRAGHGLAAGALPLHHRDPFDRMLAAQALSEDLVLVTHDRQFEPYGLRVMWT